MPMYVLFVPNKNKYCVSKSEQLASIHHLSTQELKVACHNATRLAALSVKGTPNPQIWNYFSFTLLSSAINAAAFDHASFLQYFMGKLVSAPILISCFSPKKLFVLITMVDSP